MDINTYGGMPGTGTLVSTTEAQVWSGRETDQLFSNLPVASTTVDAGNSPTTSIRPGFVFGKKTSDSLLYPYNPDAVDGTEIAYAVLITGFSTLNASAVAEVKGAHVLVGGILKAASLLTGQDGGIDNQGRRQLLLSGRFIFDDALHARPAFLGLPLNEILTGGNLTVTAAMNGSLIVNNSASATATLPAIAAGLAFEFLNYVDGDFTVASAEGSNVVKKHSITGNSVAFSTSSEKIGGHVLVFSNSAGTKWYVRNLSPGNTIT